MLLRILAFSCCCALVLVACERPPPAANSIAVLPFERLCPEKENAFFADGIYDEVVTMLATKVVDVKVISQKSVAKYRGIHNTQEIGRALNVAYVLTGIVRCEAGRVHVNAQLIDTRTNAQVWAQEYDRDLSAQVWAPEYNPASAIQSDIAKKVADQLLLRSSAK
jgi:TolB-like protein